MSLTRRNIHQRKGSATGQYVLVPLHPRPFLAVVEPIRLLYRLGNVVWLGLGQERLVLRRFNALVPGNSQSELNKMVPPTTGFAIKKVERDGWHVQQLQHH